MAEGQSGLRISETLIPVSGYYCGIVGAPFLDVKDLHNTLAQTLLIVSELG